MAFMADSRTPFVTTAVGVATWLAWKYKTKGVLAAAVILLVLVILKSSNSPYISRGMETYNGRSTYWAFEEHKIAQRPLFGYGYGIEGRLFIQSLDFRDAWFVEYTPHSSLQNGYLSLAIGIGVLGAGAFLYLMLRPWVDLFVMKGGNVLLKAAFFLVVVPRLVYSMSESGIETLKGYDGLLTFLVWLLAERYRRERLRRTKMAAMPPIDHRMQALLSC